jgi:hypothetical protein
MRLSPDQQALLKVHSSDIIAGTCQIPAGVTVISPWAFEGCANLQTITLPAGVTRIGAWVFKGCTNLQAITLPAGIATIEYGAFQGCANLQTIILPPGITVIDQQAFEGCTNLQAITLPASLTMIGSCAFAGCANLQTIILPAGVTYIDKGAFLGCTNLQTIILPPSVTAIGQKVFKGCTNLQTIILPSSITSIDQKAFKGCTNLQTIILPAGVTYIGEWAFEGCEKVTFIIIESKDKAEVARITALLPAELRSKVIPQNLVEEVTRFQEQQLNRILSTPHTSRLYRFFHDENRFMSKLVNNEAGQVLKRGCIKLPDDLFRDINEQGSKANPYYQRAQAAIKRVPLPKTTDEFEAYKGRLNKLITEYIDQAIEQAQRFSAPEVAEEVVSHCAPAV